jgi:uncharacterized membrane protein YfcA
MDLSFTLLGLAFACSTFTAIVGVGGGALLLMAMVYFVPASALIPIHGITQIASGGSRAIFGFQDVRMPIVFRCAFGGLIGTGLASVVSVGLPEKTILLVLGVSALIITWLPAAVKEIKVPAKFFWIGSVMGFLSPISGAVGPALAPFLMQEDMKRDELVTTQAACVGCIDSFKIIWFIILGFAFAPYMSTLLGLTAAVVAGSFIGTRIRGLVPEHAFQIIVKVGITGCALQILYKTLP